jgi:sugar O-acyltransferase (sialic acid O-acetyltransferase NeuD family)
MIQPARSQPPLVIHGAGGHGVVVAEAARLAGMTVLGFVDDGPNAGTSGARLFNEQDPELDGARAHVAIGDNAVRQKVLKRLVEEGRDLGTVIHPDATVSPDAVIGRGVFVGPQAVVGPRATVGDGCLINSAAVVEHDVTLGPGAHVAPTAALAGGASIGALTLVGLGAKLVPRVKLGDRCVVGAGAVVLRDAEDDQRLIGVPARVSPR